MNRRTVNWLLANNALHIRVEMDQRETYVQVRLYRTTNLDAWHLGTSDSS